MDKMLLHNQNQACKTAIHLLVCEGGTMVTHKDMSLLLEAI